MIEYERINLSERIDLCHYWYFLLKSFSYGPCICYDCYNFSQKSIDFKNIAIVHF